MFIGKRETRDIQYTEIANKYINIFELDEYERLHVLFIINNRPIDLFRIPHSIDKIIIGICVYVFKENNFNGSNQDVKKRMNYMRTIKALKLQGLYNKDVCNAICESIKRIKEESTYKECIGPITRIFNDGVPFSRFTEYEYVLWRNAVIKESDGKCIKCGSLSATNCHHILNYASYPELRYESSNGVLMCKKCHYKFHKLFGRKNNNKFQLQYYLRGY